MERPSESAVKAKEGGERDFPETSLRRMYVDWGAPEPHLSSRAPDLRGPLMLEFEGLRLQKTSRECQGVQPYNAPFSRVLGVPKWQIVPRN